jgi:hypothetical protein
MYPRSTLRITVVLAAGVTALLLLALTGAPAAAGGLVDTSPGAFVAASFTNSTDITNPWWTLHPEGSNFLYFAQEGDDCVWNLVEVQGTTGPSFFGDYAGTDARIILDRGWVDEDCELGEDFEAFIETVPEAEEVTYDWYAQDDDGNIWYLGENTFDGESFEGSFVAGCDGAEAGIVILGDPFNGAFYSQEYYEGEAEDWGKVLNFKRIDDLLCMTTKEWTPLEPGAVEKKRYCSDGTTGQLTRIDELHGRTVMVELVATDIDAPDSAGLPISDVPSCF